MRFFLLSRKPDTEYTFDVDLAVAQNNDNPVYYVQYAHARICSVLRGLAVKATTWQRCKDVDLTALQGPASPGADAAAGQVPRNAHRRRPTAMRRTMSTFYLRELASSYHSYYDAERILVDDEAVKLARLALVAATAQVLANGLAMLGVSAPQRM